MQRKLFGNGHDYWYLSLVGVHPQCQGLGIASSLIRHVLVQADNMGKRVYLETTKKETVTFYERLGFRYIDDLIIEDAHGAITLFCMLRDPELPGDEFSIDDCRPEIL